MRPSPSMTRIDPGRANWHEVDHGVGILSFSDAVLMQLIHFSHVGSSAHDQRSVQHDDYTITPSIILHHFIYNLSHKTHRRLENNVVSYKHLPFFWPARRAMRDQSHHRSSRSWRSSSIAVHQAWGPGGGWCRINTIFIARAQAHWRSDQRRRVPSS